MTAANSELTAELERLSREGVSALTDEGWAALSGLVARVNAHEGSFGEVFSAKQIGDNRWSAGYINLAPLVDELVAFVCDHSLVIVFDWGAWAKMFGLSERHGTDWVAELSVAEVLAALTTYIRAERFSSGTLYEAFEGGIMPALLNRLLDFRPGGKT